MPVTQFFCMRDAMFIIDAEENLKRCEIAAIPMCTIEWYNTLRDRYSSQSIPGQSLEERDPNNEAARQFLFGVIAHQRGQ